MILKFLSSTICAILMAASFTCHAVIVTNADGSPAPSAFGGQPGQFSGSTATIPGSAPGTTTTTTTTATAPATPANQQAAATSGKTISGNASAVDKILHPEGTGTIKTVDTEVILEPMGYADEREIIIDESIRNIKCACPYSVNDLGFECGLECAYYRPGGYRLKCYPQDIRGQEYIISEKDIDLKLVIILLNPK